MRRPAAARAGRRARAAPSPAPRRVRRRDGTTAPFDAARIEAAVARAGREAGLRDPALAAQVASLAGAALAAEFGRRAPGVEDVQDAVERALASLGLAGVARAFAGYRRQRADLREAKRQLGIRDELKLSLGAAAVLRERYLLRDSRGRVTESTGEMMDWAAAFAGLMRRLEFLPNSPALMNAGTSLGLLSGCVVLPVEDSLGSIFRALGDA